MKYFLKQRQSSRWVSILEVLFPGFWLLPSRSSFRERARERDREREMGMWDYFYSTSDFLKRNAPDQPTVKGWCSSSYGIGSAAVNKIDKAVRIDAPHKVKQCMTNEEARSRIGQAATYIAKEAACYGFHEGLKTLPGGAPVSNLSSTLNRSLRVRVMKYGN
ncbi:hypothetical protein I3843_11G171300 [Carya illinoinensis]|nr:hypothetical protein I3760_11G170400 [Carya illinoinensis]KAG7957376.1 hypothetical protein I3843_11G171300 [Carya illinoinensis]